MVVPSYSPDCFRCHFRMSRETFAFLEGLLRVCLEMIPYQAHNHGGTAPVELRKQILITIWMVANPECIISVSDRFDISRSTFYEVYMGVCTAITNNLAQRFIHLPEGNDARNTIQKFEAQRGFPSILGAIDSTHIPIQAPLKDPERYINRKSFHSVQLQVVCDMDMKFIDVFCRFPGSVHDAQVFTNSPLFVDAERNRDLQFPGNSHFIGDAAYSLKPWILTHRKKLRDSKFGNELVIYWYNIGKSMKTPTLDKEIHFPTLASQKIKIQGWNVIFVLPMLVTYVIVQHRKSKIPRLKGHISDYQVWSSM